MEVFLGRIFIEDGLGVYFNSLGKYKMVEGNVWVMFRSVFF